MSLEVALTALATFLTSRDVSAGCYLFTVSHSRLLSSHVAETGFPDFTFTFQLIDCTQNRKTSYDLDLLT